MNSSSKEDDTGILINTRDPVYIRLPINSVMTLFYVNTLPINCVKSYTTRFLTTISCSFKEVESIIS